MINKALTKIICFLTAIYINRIISQSKGAETMKCTASIKGLSICVVAKERKMITVAKVDGSQEMRPGDLDELLNTTMKIEESTVETEMELSELEEVNTTLLDNIKHARETCLIPIAKGLEKYLDRVMTVWEYEMAQSRKIKDDYHKRDLSAPTV